MAFPTLTLAGAGAEGAVTAATGTGAGVLVGTTDMPKSTSAFVFPLAASAFLWNHRRLQMQKKRWWYLPEY